MRKGSSFDKIFEDLDQDDDNNDKILYLLEKKNVFQDYENTLYEIKRKKLAAQKRQNSGINEVKNLQFQLEPSTALLFEEAAKTSSPPSQLKRKRNKENI